MLNALLLAFMILAAVGFVLSVTAHLLALLGMDTPGGSEVMFLHLGLFIVWFPAVMVSARNARFGMQRDFWKIALAGCPPWMRYGLYTLFAYALFNFILFAGTAPRHTQTGGTPPLSVVRGFSGHWMVFYAAAFAILYSRINAPHLYQSRKCPNGHVVAPTVRFCPECGSAIGEVQPSLSGP